MHTLSTWLQLFGNVIMLGGLLWAWHKASGRIAQWRAAIGARLTQLRDAIAQLVRNTQTVKPEGIPSGEEFGIHATIGGGGMSTHIEGNVDGGTPEERLARQEVENAKRADEIRALAHALRTEIDNARAAVLDKSTALSNAVRLRDIYPAAFGLLVSIAGYICQLVG